MRERTEVPISPLATLIPDTPLCVTELHLVEPQCGPPHTTVPVTELQLTGKRMVIGGKLMRSRMTMLMMTTMTMMMTMVITMLTMMTMVTMMTMLMMTTMMIMMATMTMTTMMTRLLWWLEIQFWWFTDNHPTAYQCTRRWMIADARIALIAMWSFYDDNAESSDDNDLIVGENYCKFYDVATI